MKLGKIYLFIAVLIHLLILPLNCPAADTVTTLGPSGNWLGALSIGPVKLRIALKITQIDAGFTGTWDSLDQSSKEMPIYAVEFHKSDVVLKIQKNGAVFSGVLGESGSEISGQWNQHGQSFPVVFMRTETAVTLHRPQEPKKPYPYRAEPMICTNSKAGVKLAGTLTLPMQGDHFPAVVLIAGSGAQDRDESLMGHKPFLVLADYLTRQGIAVLRLDDRGVGGSTGSLTTSSVEDLADDVGTAVAWLEQRKEIDSKHIGLIGHSEGGLIAPIVAARSPEIAFIVLMAGPGVRMDQLLQTQAAAITRANGMNDELISRARQFYSNCFDILKRQPDDQVAEKVLRELWDETIKGVTPDQRKTLGLDGDIAGQIKMMVSPWYRAIAASDPKPALMNTRCAVLAINGEKDLQVSSKENLAGTAAALKAGDNKNFKTVELPGLNHLFQTCTTGLPAEYGEIEETISPAALKLMGDWIRNQSESR